MGKLIDIGQTPPTDPLFQEGFSVSFPHDSEACTKPSPKGTGSRFASRKAIALFKPRRSAKRSNRKRRRSD